MEIGSFIELDLNTTGEYYSGQDVTRLNAARAGIYHACKLYGVNKVYIPYYQCPSVSKFLNKQGLEVLYYPIDKRFKPLAGANEVDTAFLIVNYFGILSSDYIYSISKEYRNVIIDNSPAFYSFPIDEYYNVYSPRKFFGVPDGCYVIGPNSDDNYWDYPQDSSSETSGFLLKRIEHGCSPVYAERMVNEDRIDRSDVMIMSKLTQALLANIDYEKVAEKRRANFNLAHELYKSVNLINPKDFFDKSCVPMVYPLVLKNERLVSQLADRHIYTGRWWNHVLSLVGDSSFEAFMSRYMIPLPIDQRYGEVEMTYLRDIIFSMQNNK